MTMAFRIHDTGTSIAVPIILSQLDFLFGVRFNDKVKPFY